MYDSKLNINAVPGLIAFLSQIALVFVILLSKKISSSSGFI
jgi:hypothetical protein